MKIIQLFQAYILRSTLAAIEIKDYQLAQDIMQKQNNAIDRKFNYLDKLNNFYSTIINYAPNEFFKQSIKAKLGKTILRQKILNKKFMGLYFTNNEAIEALYYLDKHFTFTNQSTKADVIITADLKEKHAPSHITEITGFLGKIFDYSASLSSQIIDLKVLAVSVKLNTTPSMFNEESIEKLLNYHATLLFTSYACSNLLHNAKLDIKSIIALVAIHRNINSLLHKAIIKLRILIKSIKNKIPLITDPDRQIKLRKRLYKIQTTILAQQKKWPIISGSDLHK